MVVETNSMMGKMEQNQYEKNSVTSIEKEIKKKEGAAAELT